MCLLAIAGCGGDERTTKIDEREPGDANPIVRSCKTRVEGRLASDWRQKSVVVGPLAFAYGYDLSRQNRRGLVDEKILVVLKARHEATVVVPPSKRGQVSLDYDGFGGGHFPPRLSDGVPAVRFIACRGSEKTFSPTHSLRSETQFNGGIIARWPSCVDLDVFTDGRDTPERVTIPFGAGACGDRG